MGENPGSLASSSSLSSPAQIPSCNAGIDHQTFLKPELPPPTKQAPSPKRKRSNSSTEIRPQKQAARSTGRKSRPHDKHHAAKGGLAPPTQRSFPPNSTSEMRFLNALSSPQPILLPKNDGDRRRCKPARQLVPITLGPIVDGASPRTRVAYHFSGLHLDSASPPPFPILGPQPDNASTSSPTSTSSFSSSPNRHSIDSSSNGSVHDAHTADMIHRRMRLLSGGGAHHTRSFSQSTADSCELPEPSPVAGKTFQICIGKERRVDPLLREKAGEVRLWNELDLRVLGGPESSARVRSRCAEMELERERRMGTPPLRAQDISTGADAANDEAKTWLHGEWAALYRKDLTWSDDEITGHQPSDPEDDGEGINGVGFKPTKAMAWQRMQARRRQVEEYKTREEREARAARRMARCGPAEKTATKRTTSLSRRPEEARTSRGGTTGRNVDIAATSAHATTNSPSSSSSSSAKNANAIEASETRDERREKIARDMEDAVRRVRFLDGETSSTSSSRYR